MVIKTAGPINAVKSERSSCGIPIGGKPVGTAPTTETSRAGKSNPQERKQLIGERLFLRINSIIGDGQRSIKIVSKLLHDDNEELLIMCFDMNYLKKVINCISDPTTNELRNPRK